MIYDSTRNAYFDNAKFLLIALVIVGHLIEPLIESNGAFKSAYLFIYSFHIPAFVLIAGYFAKRIKDFHAKQLKYFLLFLAFTLLYWPLSGRSLLTNLVIPYWVLWFLVSLILWYTLLPFFNRLKHPIIIAVIIALLIGYVDQIGYAMSLSRTIVFFPFFLAGYYLDIERMKEGNRWFSTAFIFVLLLVLLFSANRIDHRWLWGSFPYAALGFPQWYAGLYRLAVYLIAAIMVYCFLTLVPSRTRIYSRLGSQTLYIYLFHGLIIKLLA